MCFARILYAREGMNKKKKIFYRSIFIFSQIIIIIIIIILEIRNIRNIKDSIYILPF
jgi:hypothetical protein